jgi:hypothetical protein
LKIKQKGEQTMSHFTVLVIGEEPKKQLDPYWELDLTDEEASKDPRAVFVDETEEMKKEYETENSKEFYCSSNSSWGFELSKEIFKELKESPFGREIKYIKNESKMNYLKKRGKYNAYYTTKNRNRCQDRSLWFEVISITKTNHPDEDVCFEGKCIIRKIKPPKRISHKTRYTTFEEFAERWYKRKPNENGKYGYWHNPNAKWDWYELGGRWTGFFKLKNHESESGKLWTDNQIAKALSCKFYCSEFLMLEAIRIYKEDKLKLSDFMFKNSIKNGYNIEKEIEKLLRLEYPNALVGNPGLGTVPPKQGYADKTYKKFIDFEFMRAEKGNKAKKEYESIQKIFEGEIPKLDYLWKDIVGGEKYKDLKIDDKRKLYNSQQGIKRLNRLKKKYDHNSEKGKIIHRFYFSLDDFQCSKEEYTQKARDKAICTFAVLKDNKWYSRGDMGWWGAVSNEKEQENWDKEFNKLLEGLSEDTLLSVYDCHI